MSEKNETDLANAQDPSKDRIGDILRKERITRRITVETIAKDLKLNVKYIKSLEASEYESLPADPYVRVYLRSLAKYLSLDPDEILKRFYEERGLSADLKKDVASKITITMKEKEARNPMLLIAIILISLLAVFSFIANRQGWISAPHLNDAKSDSTMASAKSDSSAVDSLVDSIYSNPAVQATDTVNKIASVDSSVQDTGRMRLHIEAIRDSAWVQVYSDGQSWKNIISQNLTKEFFANDSFNIHVGNNSILRYTLNGNVLKVKGNGVVVFKIIKNSQPIVWSNTRWNAIFKDRN